MSSDVSISKIPDLGLADLQKMLDQLGNYGMNLDQQLEMTSIKIQQMLADSSYKLIHDSLTAISAQLKSIRGSKGFCEAILEVKIAVAELSLRPPKFNLNSDSAPTGNSSLSASSTSFKMLEIDWSAFKKATSMANFNQEALNSDYSNEGPNLSSGSLSTPTSSNRTSVSSSFSSSPHSSSRSSPSSSSLNNQFVSVKADDTTDLEKLNYYHADLTDLDKAKQLVMKRGLGSFLLMDGVGSYPLNNVNTQPELLLVRQGQDATVVVPLFGVQGSAGYYACEYKDQPLKYYPTVQALLGGKILQNKCFFAVTKSIVLKEIEELDLTQ